MDKEKLIKKLSSLKQYKDTSHEELEKIADAKIQETELLSSLSYLTDENEKQTALELLTSYTEEFKIENSADKNTLHHLIYQEILANRIKNLMNKENQEKDGAVSIKLSEELREVENQIIELKKSLGMAQKDDQINNIASIIEDWKLRFKKWINRPENRSNYTVRCVKCGEWMLIRRRLDKEKDEVLVHPWFILGGILFNREIFIDYTKGYITKEQVARYLNTQPSYVDWIIKHYSIEEDKKEC